MKRLVIIAFALSFGLGCMAQVGNPQKNTVKYTRGNYILTTNNQYRLVVPSNDRYSSEGIVVNLGNSRSQAIESLRLIAEKIENGADGDVIEVGGYSFTIRKWEQGNEIYADIITPTADSKSLYVMPLAQVKRSIRQIK